MTLGARNSVLGCGHFGHTMKMHYFFENPGHYADKLSIG